MRNFILGLSACILFSCSGGGGSSTTPTTPTTPPVAPTNTPPVIAAPNAAQSGFMGFEFGYDATQSGTTFTDRDADTLTYSVSISPQLDGLSVSNSTISGTPTQTGTITATITANDGNGNSTSDSFDISIGIDQSSIQTTFGGNIDLENLANYAAQPVPNYITKSNNTNNPLTDEIVTLGRVLFYDTALSFNGEVSCSSCHAQTNGFSDLDTVSTGVEGGQTLRHSMRLINTSFADETHFFWDERADTQEAQESEPLIDHDEHGFSGLNGRPTFADLVTKLEAIEYYEELFRFAYHDPEITEARLQQALAQFTRSIQSFDSKFDEGRSQVNDDDSNFPNFTADENTGKQIFLSGNLGGCDRCHRAPEFDIRPNSGHNGVVGIAGNPNTHDLTNTRSPTLRDLVDPNGAPNGPFMHDGSLATLRDVVDHYDAIPTPGNAAQQLAFLESLDNRLKNGNGANSVPQQLNLSETQKSQLIAFLTTLTGNNLYTDEKWSDPFPTE